MAAVGAGAAASSAPARSNFTSLRPATYHKAVEARPQIVGWNYVLTVVSRDEATADGGVLAQVGDETGLLAVEAPPRYADLIKPGNTLVLRNTTISVRGGRLVLSVDEFGKIATHPDGIASTPPPPEFVDTSNVILARPAPPRTVGVLPGYGAVPGVVGPWGVGSYGGSGGGPAPGPAGTGFGAGYAAPMAGYYGDVGAGAPSRGGGAGYPDRSPPTGFAHAPRSGGSSGGAHGGPSLTPAVLAAEGGDDSAADAHRAGHGEDVGVRAASDAAVVGRFNGEAGGHGDMREGDESRGHDAEGSGRGDGLGASYHVEDAGGINDGDHDACGDGGGGEGDYQ